MSIKVQYVCDVCGVELLSENTYEIRMAWRTSKMFTGDWGREGRVESMHFCIDCKDVLWKRCTDSVTDFLTKGDSDD